MLNQFDRSFEPFWIEFCKIIELKQAECWIDKRIKLSIEEVSEDGT